MHLFSSYIQPMTIWLNEHPHLALMITFLISLTESLAVIGSIIPGSVSMTAIGILAGSGLMRIDLTYAAATLGAIAGDVSSYALGYVLSDRIFNIWPFKNYPRWITYGQEYFARYGPISVLIGRFIGPLRSIIPMIAGMMRMNQWQFLCANVISAIGWAILYVTPGVLIGAASTELSPENTTRLFVIILMLLGVIWLASLGLRWLVFYIAQFLKHILQFFWVRTQQFTYLAPCIKAITPPGEQDNNRTAALLLSIIFLMISTIILSNDMVQEAYLQSLNTPISFFVQSLRTPAFDKFFIFLSLSISLIPLLTLSLVMALCWIFTKNWRTLLYWLSLCGTSIISACLLIVLMDSSPEPNTFLPLALPLNVIELTLTTSLVGFLILYLKTYYAGYLTKSITGVLILVLSLAAFGQIYLNDNAVSIILITFSLGATLFLLHWLFYRRFRHGRNCSNATVLILCISFTFAVVLTNGLFFKKMVHLHMTQLGQYVVTEEAWWHQQKPLLPLYSRTRLGRRTGLLNIQYVGTPAALEKALQSQEWKRQTNSFFHALLMRAGGKKGGNVPLATQLYLNRKPVLIMTKVVSKNEFLILRLWRSNFHLRHYPQPIWIGSVSFHNTKGEYEKKEAYSLLLRALPDFQFQQFIIPRQYLHTLPYHASPTVIMIKETHNH